MTWEQYEIAKVVREEGESRLSAAILVDVSRSGLILILRGEEQKNHYAGPESRRWVGSVRWKESQWRIRSFPGG